MALGADGSPQLIPTVPAALQGISGLRELDGFLESSTKATEAWRVDSSAETSSTRVMSVVKPAKSPESLAPA